MKINAKDIQKLREKTSAGVMDCKKALTQAKGDFEKAIEVLREQGIALAKKKAARTASEGRIEAYVHMHNRIGVLVEMNCETDFVAKCDDFKHLCKDVAMQIAALNPRYIKKEDVPKEIAQENKSRLEEFCKENCLLEQAFIKDQAKTMKDYLTEVIAKIGENIVIRRFIRFQLGEES
ncbi:MAG: translation elongation factor Ts [Candidatus Omnitrophica bacterium]|nr:translation elongation factor Ts [Candidatus Omnitrophota bacterium]